MGSVFKKSCLISLFFDILFVAVGTQRLPGRSIRINSVYSLLLKQSSCLSTAVIKFTFYFRICVHIKALFIGPPENPIH